MKFERWFAGLTEKLEHFLFKLALCFLLLLIVSQIVMTNENIRTFLSAVDQIEGISYNQYGQEEKPAFTYLDRDEEQYSLVLAAETKYPVTQLKVLINTEKAYSFDNSKAEIKVSPGDMIEIDGKKYDYPIKVHVKEASSEIKPALSKAQVVTNGTVELLGWVIKD